GSRPARPKEIDFADHCIHDSDEILEIEHLPGSLTILGAGVIGCEYACMFAALGVEVTLVDARDSLLSFLDAEMVAQLVGSMLRIGIDLKLGWKWTSVRREGDSIAARFDNGGEIFAEQLLFAAGREGRT